MANHIKGKVRKFVEAIKSKVRVWELTPVIAVVIATFGLITLVSADAASGSSIETNSDISIFSLQNQETTEIVTTTERETTTLSTTEAETTTSTEVVTTTVSTTVTSTMQTETTTACETTSVDVITETEASEVLENYAEAETFGALNMLETETEAVVDETIVYYDEERTRPVITSGQERLASMMANEGGSSDITCIRTAIGFMNRIHNSQFQYGSIENVSGYCFSTPNQHHLELAAEVIEAYNGSDSWWYDYCVEHQLTDKTVYHHNGTTVQWFEQPGGYVEYGDTGWYQWTLLYSEGIYDHY